MVLVFQAVKGSAPAYLQKIIKPYTPARPLCSSHCGAMPGASPSPYCNLLVTTVGSGSTMVEWPPRRVQNSRDSDHLQAQTKDTPLEVAPLHTPTLIDW